ncbi:MAG: hypothetical protein J6L69_11585 [Lachnospiraceae bacterium]|nr:hypothetical protein [Lachnospiraceae bacterium]
MKKRKILIATCSILVILAVVIGSILWKNIDAKAEYSNDYAKTFGEFTANTTKKLFKESKENTCFSPVSMFAALSLAAEVTEGDTREELLNYLGVESIEELEDKYAHLLRDITVMTQGARLKLANAFWYVGGEPNDDDMENFDSLENNFNCKINPREKILGSEVNKWVSEETNGLIDKLIEEDDEYSILLANALYYKAKWQVDFKKKSDEQEFYLESGDSTKTEFICCENGTMKYDENKMYTYVEIPLLEGNLVVVLPKKNTKLDDILSQEKLNDILATYSCDDKKEGLVKLEMPMYEIGNSWSDELIDVMNKNNVNKLFEEPDWIKSISGVDARIKQETRFILNEEGIEAAAVTSVGATYLAKGENKPELELTVDRPFLYVLMKDDVPLFIGTVYNPTE